VTIVPLSDDFWSDVRYTRTE